MSKVTVVTPFYNTAPFLAECIESVLAQTHADFDYVLVDNHSTDGGNEIAARYRDPRIRIVSPPTFLGQVPNFNFAMRQVAPDAKWVKMVQADDTIFPTCLAEMTALGDAHPTIAIVSSYRMYGEHVKPSGLSHTRTFMTGRDACRLVLKDEIYVFGSPTTTMWRADVVRAHDPFFVEGRYFEDTENIFELLKTHDFGFVHQILSFTRTDNDSLWSGMRAYNGLLLSKRNQLKQFGRHYLNDREYAAAWAEQDGDYRRYLAEQFIRGADEKFWEFHRKGLATVGDTIDRVQLARDVVRAAPRRVADLVKQLRR